MWLSVWRFGCLFDDVWRKTYVCHHWCFILHAGNVSSTNVNNSWWIATLLHVEHITANIFRFNVQLQSRSSLVFRRLFRKLSKGAQRHAATVPFFCAVSFLRMKEMWGLCGVSPFQALSLFLYAGVALVWFVGVEMWIVICCYMVCCRLNHQYEDVIWRKSQG